MLINILILLVSIFGAQEPIITVPGSPYQPQLDSLNDSARVDYVLDHFYEIYSKDLEEAIILTDYAVKLSVNNEWKTREAYSRLRFAVANYLAGDHTQALKSFQEASDIFDSLKHYAGIAALNNELAVFYRKQDNIDKMLETLNKGEEAARKINDLTALSINYHHRGTIYSRKGDYDQAYPYFTKVLDIRLELQDSVGLGYIYLDLAEYHANKDNLPKAIQFIEKSTAIRQAMNDVQGVAVNEVAMGELYFGEDEYQRAIPYFEETIKMAKAIGYIDLLRYASGKLQQCYNETGEYKNAYKTLAEYQTFNDSIFNVEKTRAISEMEAKYETEKKEKLLAKKDAELQANRLLIGILAIVAISLVAIGLQQRRKMILKREKLLEQEKRKTTEMEIKAALASQEQERSRVARDLHDGFGQMISILNLNLKSLENAQADRHEIFAQSAKVLENMYQELKSICFNLMPQTLIQSGITAALNEFAARVSQTGKVNVETDFFGMEERLSEVQEISLYRISQEWVNNMLKYSNADKATIQITRDLQEITLMIEDNGDGFDLELLKSGKGNGWRNMNSRANLMSGVLEVDTTPGMRGNTLIVNAVMMPVTASVEA